MRFAANGFYVESYDKCCNCGVLLYRRDAAIERDKGGLVCGEWCLQWAENGAQDVAASSGAVDRSTYRGKTDVVDLKILDGNLASICRDMGVTVMRTAYSPIFSESLDFTCGLFDASGAMIAVGDFCPSMIGGMPLIVQAIVDEYPVETLEEGDVIVHNDPYRGGMHTPEHTFLKPIFRQGALVGFAGAIGHIGEIGGMVPGSFFAEATEAFSEGLRIPPVRIKRAGQDCPDVWKMMLANVRTPRANYGDYRALIAAVDLGERRLLELVERYGATGFAGAAADLLDYSEARMRAEIADIPDGRYAFEDMMEDDGVEARALPIKTAVHVGGNEAVVDFNGTAPQARGPMNTPLSVPQAAAFNAFLQITDFTIPRMPAASGRSACWFRLAACSMWSFPPRRSAAIRSVIRGSSIRCWERWRRRCRTGCRPLMAAPGRTSCLAGPIRVPASTTPPTICTRWAGADATAPTATMLSPA